MELCAFRFEALHGHERSCTLQHSLLEPHNNPQSPDARKIRGQACSIKTGTQRVFEYVVLNGNEILTLLNPAETRIMFQVRFDLGSLQVV